MLGQGTVKDTRLPMLQEARNQAYSIGQGQE